MKRVYKKKSKLINKTGYTPGYDTEKNPVNYIPSENITMANTPYPLKGTPLDENGNAMGKSIVMFPGEDYNFDGASYVEEKPFFQKGGKKTIYVESKNDPRYIAYQDSASAYNKSIRHKNKTLKNIKEILDEKDWLDKVISGGKDDIIKVKTKESYDKYPGGIKPIASYYFKTPDDLSSEFVSEVFGGYDVLKKPQEQVILRPTTTKKNTKPFVPAQPWVDPETGIHYTEKPIKPSVPQKRQPVKSIQNNLQPEELAQSDIELNADVSGLRPQARMPKDYDIESQRQNMSGQSNYYDYNKQGLTLEKVMEIQDNADKYNQGVIDKYGEAAKTNPKAKERLDKLMQNIQITPNYQVGGEVMFTVSGNQPLIIPSQGSYPFDYNKNLPVNEAGMPYVTDTDGKKILLSSSRKVPTKDEFGNNLPMKQIRENQKIWNYQKEAYSPGQDDFNAWKNNAENTQQGFYNRREYDKIVKKFNKLPDVEQEGTCDPNFDSTECGISKAAAKQSKKDFKRKEEGGFFKTKQNNMNSNMMPNFGNGGEKNKWISAKISKLVREEGYPQKQAVAMAYSMYEDMKKENGGYQLPMYQTAGKYNFGNTFAGSNFAKPKFGADPNVQSPEAFSASLDKITEVNPGEYGLGKDPNKPNPLSSESLTAGQDFKKRTDEIGKAAGVPETMPTNVFGAEVEDSKPKTETATTGLQKPDIQGSQPFQFFNPYSGVDIPSASVMFGQSLENKDTLGAIASGAKVALGTARNILGGMGQARRENYVKNQYAEKQREGMTGQGREQMARFGGYYQEGGMEPGIEENQMLNPQEQGMEQQGGQEQQIMQEVAQMLQQGADPQQVIQQLVQMGVPEDQAVQMVESVMQQMQGSTPQLKRGGMMYYQDGGEDDEDGGEYPEDGEDEYEDEEEPNYMINKPSLMGKQQNFSQPGLAVNPAIESAVEATSLTKEETPSYDKNSARDTWVAKTGMPWSEAKRLGYTTGSAKDNIKLLSELNDPRFNKKYLRSKPLSPAKKKSQNINAYGIDTNSDYVVKWREEQDRKSKTKKYGGYYQDGGEQQVAQQAAQALQQGAQPEQVMQMLLESGMTQDQAIQLVQAIMQQVQQQGGMEEGTPQMRRGGEMIKRADGSYSRRGLWDNIRDNRGSGKEPTKEMLEQERKIKANKKEMGGYMYEDGGINNPGFKALPDYVQEKIMANMYQEGGMETEADPTEAIMQQVSQMLQQGADPQEILQMLVEAGVPEEQAMQMVEAVMQQMEEPEGTPQMRDGGIPERYRKMGFTKVGAKRQSTSPGKKWMVLAKKGDQYKIVHGGDSNMKDFSQHGSEERKDRFWNRMGGRDSAKANDPFSPLYWHKKFGTWQEGGEMMDEEMEGENESMENESAMLEQIESQVEEALKQGADPQQLLEQLVQMGIPQEQAIQMIQEILQEIEGGETESEAPEMKNGGSYLNALKGKTIKDYTYNPKTNSYTVSYE